MTAESDSIRIYEESLALHGDSYRSLNWGSSEGQILRFEVLSKIADLNCKSILDVGCGLGHFADWLETNRIAAAYSGVELTPGLAHAARRRRPDLEIANGSILSPECLSGRTFDYVFASGIFYTYVENGYAVLRDSIAGMWNLCSLGIAFNSLSTWAAEKDFNEFYADPLVVLNIAREFTPWVVLRHDYHARDFTVYMKRERSEA